MKKKYLNLYKRLMETGTRYGLCYEVKVNLGIGQEILLEEIFMPKAATRFQYWAGVMGDFNDTRQNILLLMAAMNGEL